MRVLCVRNTIIVVCIEITSPMYKKERCYEYPDFIRNRYKHTWYENLTSVFTSVYYNCRKLIIKLNT